MKRKTLLKCVGGAALVFAFAAASSGQSMLQLDRAPRFKPGPPATYGTTVESFFSVPEWEFSLASSAGTYSDDAIGGMNARRYGTGGGAAFFGPVHLPDGALLTSVGMNLCDSSTTDNHWTIGVESCGTGDGLCVILAGPVVSVSNTTTPCAPYALDVSALNYTVSNQNANLILVAIPSAADTTNSLVGAIVGYKLQVSPAPNTPTFGDVPVDHPFFQFIEALAKSGITGGCGSGNYCPDNPVTRGQMAVFLAKALGLQFP